MHLFAGVTGGGKANFQSKNLTLIASPWAMVVRGP